VVKKVVLRESQAPYTLAVGDEIMATVAIRGGWHARELQGKVKHAGGKWNPRRRVWEIRYDRMVELGL